jgi:hypothetical protein
LSEGKNNFEKIKNMIKHTEELELKFENYSQLSFEDLDEEYVQLFLDNESVGLVEVSTDVENQKREYIIVNHEIIYLDTIKSRT